MRNWLIAALVCCGAAQAHAGGTDLISTPIPGLIGFNGSNKFVNVTAGAMLGTTSTDIKVTQSASKADVYAVGQITLAKPGSNPVNSADVTQVKAQHQTAIIPQYIYFIPNP